MSDRHLPGRDALKDQAKKLRAALQSKGTPITHSMSLEAVAKQWGFADWNTLSAATARNALPDWAVGQRVQGSYLGKPFEGQLKAVRRAQGGYTYVTIVFDTFVPVVEIEGLTHRRKQVNACVTENGVTVEKTSNGQPHLRLQPA